MKKVLFITISLFVALSANLKAGNGTDATNETIIETASSQFALNGIVFDKQTNESLAGVVVTANGQKVYTDLDGNFTLNNMCKGKCTLKISLISYEDQIIEVDTNNLESLQVELSQR